MPWTLSTVELHWTDHAKNEDLWNASKVLYAYLNPHLHDKILYIGKADGTTVGERFDADDKHSLWDAIEKEFGLYETDLKVIVGEFKLAAGKNLTSELISDIEALLIEAEQPWGNIQAKESHSYTRRNLLVKCTGEWPGEYTEYKDE